MNVLDTRRINQSLRRRYILALSIIALLVVFSQGLVQYALIDQDADSRIVNIAGRQRMLSQRITKCSLILQSNIPSPDKQPYREELKLALGIWIQSHAGLQNGDAELGLPGKNSPKITGMFKKIESQFQTIVWSAKIIADADAARFGGDEALAAILNNQADFLRGMDEIVFQYDAEAKQKITTVKQIETGILLVTFLTLFLEALFIFRPAEKHIQKTFEEYQQSEAGFKRLFDMAPTPMMMLSVDEGKLVRINEAASNLLDLSREGGNPKILADFWEGADKGDVAWNHVLSRDCVAGVELPMHLRGRYAMVMVFTTRTKYEGQPHMILGLVDITAKHTQTKRLEQLASTDAMTGVLNRRAFLENLELAIAKNKEGDVQLSLAFIDLDGLKKVNDTYGHQEGDWYIATIASFLRNATRENDMVGRLGGDEFAALFPACPQNVAERIIVRIQQQVETIAAAMGKPYSMGISFGVVSATGGDCPDAEELVKKADDAMYRQKHQRRNGQMGNVESGRDS